MKLSSCSQKIEISFLGTVVTGSLKVKWQGGGGGSVVGGVVKVGVVMGNNGCVGFFHPDPFDIYGVMEALFEVRPDN